MDRLQVENHSQNVKTARRQWVNLTKAIPSTERYMVEMFSTA